LESRVASPVLQVKDLNLQLAQRHILRDITFSLPQGRMLGVVGPNGAGKSSLLKLLHGELMPSSGQIWLKNRPLQELSRRELAQQLAVVVQSPVPVFSLTTEQLLMMGLVPHKSWFAMTTSEDRQQIELALSKTGLTDLRTKTLDSLSGGELQRAFIARALVQNARVLLLDEPTNHLDVHYQHQILALIKQLGLTIVCCLHDLNLAASYCDDILLLNEGQICALGSADEVLQPELLSRVFRQPCRLIQQPGLARPIIHFYPVEREALHAG
jgi:iron complex transport system ATP-binding protein